MRKRTLATIAVLLVASACTSGGEESAGSTSSADPTPRGGTLRVAVPDFTPLIELDPQRAYEVPGWELFRCCLLRTLYSYNGRPTDEGGGEPQPDLAVGPPEVSADGLTWTFRLRPGLRYAPPFEDTPIIALDVVRALERTARLTSPPAGYPFYFEGVISGFEDYGSGAADSIVGLETPDERTLVVRLDRVTGDLVYRFSLAATAPIPEGADEGHDEDYARYLVASGPYMIEGSKQLDFSAPPGEQVPTAGFVPAVLTEDDAVQEPGSLVLVRNPSWDPATDQLRAAYVDRIELTLGAMDEAEIARRVDQADVDLVFGSSPFEQVARYRDDPELEGRVFVNKSDLFWSVTMNLAVPPFDDVHVRRAVARAIDRAALVEMLSQPPHGPFGFSWGETETHMAPDALEGRLLRDFDPYPYDPEAAREEMRASDYDQTGDGRCDAAVCRNVRALVMDEGVLLDQARAIRGDLAEVGIELELDPVPVEEFFGDVDLDPIPGGSIHDPSAQIPMGIAYPWGQDFPEGAGWFSPLFDQSGLEGAYPSNTSLVGATPGQLRGWGYRVTSVPGVEDRIQLCLARRGVARTRCWTELDQYLTTEIVSRVSYWVTEHAQVVSERVVAYSFAQFPGLPALDRIAITPGSS
jgi:peptide/nickel transport system substrate-binding protein